MPSIPSSDYSNSSIPTAKTVVVPGEPNTKRQIRKITYTNNAGAEATIDLYINATGADEVRFVNSKKIAYQQTWSCIDAEGHVLEQNGTISIKSNIADIALVITTIYIT